MSWKALNWSISIEVETPIERLILMLLSVAMKKYPLVAKSRYPFLAR